MPDTMEQIVQRMIDAGETEDNIASVIQEMSASKPAAPESGGISPWLVGAGAAAAGAGVYAATRNPGAARTAFNGLNDVRRMSMLSGLAPLKSLLGNIGGSAYASIERGSMAPLTEMLSPTTAKEAWNTFKSAAGPTQTSAGPATGLTRWNIPGRIMGSLDQASQSALMRAGFSQADAAKEMLQAPVRGGLVDSMTNNPVAEYLFPFKRTPMNQMTEGLESVAPRNLRTTGQKVALGTAIGTGAATGYEADDPKTIAMGTAFSGRRGLPFAAGAAVGRYARSGSKRAAADALQGMTPISDYSLQEGILEPTKVIPKPAAISAWDYLRSMLGMD